MNRAFIAFLVWISSGAVDVSSALSQDNDWLLSQGRAGKLEIGVTVDELYKQFGRENVRLVDLQREGRFDPALQIYMSYDPGMPAIIAPISRNPCGVYAVTGLYVHDPRFRTAKGLGVGSTVGEVRRAYEVRLSREEGHKILVEALAMNFAIAGSNFADSVRITSVAVRRNPMGAKKGRCT